VTADAQRRSELGAIHIAKKQLALADESYRALVWRFSGAKSDSAAELSTVQRRELLDHFRGLGFERKPKRQPARAGSRPLAHNPLASKIRALWLSLYHLGEVESPKEEAIAAYVTRMTGVEALQWIDLDKADQVIRSLRAWCARIGFHQPDAERVRNVNAWRARNGLSTEPYGYVAKLNLIDAQWKRLIARGAFRTGASARLDSWLIREAGVSADFFLAPADADRCVERLGAWIRKLKPSNTPVPPQGEIEPNA
jgi:phage gp16-like protein